MSTENKQKEVDRSQKEITKETLITEDL